MTQITQLYEEDFYEWTRQQARVLRDVASAGANLPLDWENLAEEVESSGKSVRSALRSRLSTIIEHLLKLDYSPADESRAGWRATIRRERLEIEDLLEENPSLRREVPDLVSATMPRTARLAAEALTDFGELGPSDRESLLRTNYAPEQVLGEWFPAQRELIGRTATRSAAGESGDRTAAHPPPPSEK